ncbi:MSF1-domain-containing protein [Teratosphaeria nubilosa]|uniref:MSF1-domain-containing protein n=1 Tax=Teratosphaeria nubilosa TaxID=161662 RepID=A0A6G1KTF7_9PEZI|nr:MSF1-domain-containing protein [Teratosphaeria nubilosa]
MYSLIHHYKCNPFASAPLLLTLPAFRLASSTTSIHSHAALGDGSRQENDITAKMVKFYSSNYSYDYGFSAVSLAYFLRYPNPYSRHVASTDTISRNYDPEMQRLTTVRLHLKRSRLPPAVLKLLPKSTLGADGDGRTQSFILETSVVDVKEGWMETESRNLDWNNVLSVIERQSYRRPALSNPTSDDIDLFNRTDAVLPPADDRTDVAVSVTLKSRIGEQLRKRRARWGEQATATSVSGIAEEEPVKQGWFSAWSSGAIRSAIESISLQRTEKSQPKAQMGMSVVLDRLRNGGVQAVLEGMRQDREVEV